jgi:enoyl-CoA hydratase/carnithine racemase
VRKEPGEVGFNSIAYEKGEGIALVSMNRPKSLNALCDELIGELGGPAFR